MEEMAWNTSLEEFTHIPDTTGQGLVESSIGIIVKDGSASYIITFNVFLKLFISNFS
jgi:hypothetical protein